MGTHFNYAYMASDIWLRTTQIVREEIRCRHIGQSFRLAARVLLYAPSHRQDSTYHGLCYTSRGTWMEREIAQWVHPMKDRSDDPLHHERTLLPWSYISLRPLLQLYWAVVLLQRECHNEITYSSPNPNPTVLSWTSLECQQSDML